MVLHKYADNNYGIGHGGENCVCSPTVERKSIQLSSGRGGRHQGYRYEKVVKHNLLPAK
jgi:hypothetical protein